MNNFSHLLHPNKRVHFVQTNSSLESFVPSTSASTTLNALNLDSTTDITDAAGEHGEEVQQFYQQIIATSSTASSNKHDEEQNEIEILDDTNDPDIVVLHETQSSPNLHSLSSSVQEQSSRKKILDRDVRLFLKAAADNDLTTVSFLHSQGMNLEVQDLFRWTALMCAAATGAEQVVQFLLNKGANPAHHDYAGRTALELAHRCEHFGTKKILENFRREQEANWLSDTLKQKCELNRVFCEACQCHYTDLPDAHALHESSMLHMINTGLIPQDGFSYGISAKNPGYKLLKSYGWSEEKGLGKQGQGRKYPIKTMLKRDTKGLGLASGSGTSKATDRLKVTHFGPMDIRAVDNAKGKKERPISMAKQRAMAKAKEAQLRRMFEEEE